MTDAEIGVSLIDKKRDSIKTELLASIRCSFPELKKYLEYKSAPVDIKPLYNGDSQIALKTIGLFSCYFEGYDDYEYDILEIINYLGPFLFDYSQLTPDADLTDKCWNLILILVRKKQLPSSYVQRLQEHLEENEQNTFRVIISQLSMKVFVDRERYVDRDQISDLMQYATWLLDAVFKEMTYDTDVHQEAIANFATLLVGLNKLCRDYIPNARETALNEHMRKAIGFAVENGKHSDTILYWVTKPGLGALQLPSPTPQLLFTLAEFLNITYAEDLDSADSELVEDAFINVENYLEKIVLEMGITHQLLLPLLTELRYRFEGRIRTLIEDLFSEHLEAVGFHPYEVSHLLSTWIDSYSWSEQTENSWERSEKLLKKIGRELHHISSMQSKVVGAPTLLYRDFGIVHFSRYPLRLLLRQAQRELSKADGELLDQDKPLAVVITAINDHNFAFDKLLDQLMQLDEASEERYQYILLEFEYKNTLREKLQELRNTKGRFSLMLLSGHGSEVSIQLGKKFSVGAMMTIKDAFLGIVRDPARYFRLDGMIILNSCSTTRQREIQTSEIDDAAEIPVNIPHIAAALEQSFQVTVVGPDEPSWINEFVVTSCAGSSLPIIDVTYGSQTKPSYPGVVVSSNKNVSTRV